MRLTTSIASIALLISGCGDGEAPAASAAASADIGARAPAAAVTESGSSTSARAASPTLAGRTGEIANPEDSTMVLLYHDLAGIALPLDIWVEDDPRLRSASPADKAARRAAVRAEIQSAADGVRNIGAIRLSMNADLSEYDPTYGEFTIRALAPSSEVRFKALRENVVLRFANGSDAQVWQLSPAQAQMVRDKLGYGGASLDALLRITGVQPAPGGGAILTEVIEYELRENRRGTVLGRVQVSY